jgi:hypothetical protein
MSVLVNRSEAVCTSEIFCVKLLVRVGVRATPGGAANKKWRSGGQLPASSAPIAARMALRRAERVAPDEVAPVGPDFTRYPASGADPSKHDQPALNQGPPREDMHRLTEKKLRQDVQETFTRLREGPRDGAKTSARSEGTSVAHATSQCSSHDGFARSDQLPAGITLRAA